jgi:hypothetical protein
MLRSSWRSSTQFLPQKWIMNPIIKVSDEIETLDMVNMTEII